MKTKKQVLTTDDDAAKYLTNIKGWVDINGRYYGNDEKMARWSSATHRPCEGCGVIVDKSWTHCPSCREKRMEERYKKLESKPFDDFPVAIYNGDEYFFDADHLSDYCYDAEIDAKDLMLVHCRPQYLSQIDSDYWSDELPEDEYDLPYEVALALEELNKAIRNVKQPSCWFQTNIAISNPEAFQDGEVMQ